MQSAGPFDQGRHGEVFGHDERSALSERDQVRAAMPRALEVKGGADASVFKLSLNVKRAFKDKGVVSVGRMWVAFTQSVVNEHGQSELVGGCQGCIERWIVVCSLRRPEPIQDKLAGRVMIGEHTGAFRQMLWQAFVQSRCRLDRIHGVVPVHQLG